MAAPPLSTTRRALLGAAASVPLALLSPSVIASGAVARQPKTTADQSSAVSALWNRRLARYKRLHARWKAQAETGAFRVANDEYGRTYAELTARFGSWEKARRSKIGKPLCAAAFAQVTAAEHAFYRTCTSPMYRAATRLTLTPAPDLPALLTKIDLILEHDFESLDGYEGGPWEVVRQDVRGLMGA